MEFGVFVGMYHPEHRRADGGDRAGRAAGRARRRAGGRSVRVQVRVGHRAPLPRRVLAPLGQRGVDGVRARDHRQHPHRLGDHQHHTAGLPPGARRREGGDARPARAGPLRVRHRARLVVDRGARVRHRLHGHHARHVRRGAARDRQDDGTRRVRALRGRVLLAAAPPGAAEAGHAAAPADLGRRGLTGHVREGGAHGHRRPLLQLRRRRGAQAADRDLQERPSRTPSPSAAT